MSKISALPSTTTPTGADLVPVVNGGVTKQTTLGNVVALTYELRNKIINGNFLVNQRAVTGTVTLAANAYGHDRWKAGASGCTYTFSTTNNVTTITITAGSLKQVVEGNSLKTGTYILSWTGTAQGRFNTGTYSASGVTSSVTGGTNLTIEFNTGTVSLVQLEAGSVATTFEPRNLALETTLCQRYYEAGTGYYVTYGASASNIQRTFVYFNTTKRAVPSSTTTLSSGSASSVSPAVSYTNGILVGFGAASAGAEAIFTYTADAEL